MRAEHVQNALENSDYVAALEDVHAKAKVLLALFTPNPAGGRENTAQRDIEAVIALEKLRAVVDEAELLR